MRFRLFCAIVLLMAGASVAGYFQARHVDVAPLAAPVTASLENLPPVVRINSTVVAEQSAMIRAPRIMGSSRSEDLRHRRNFLRLEVSPCAG